MSQWLAGAMFDPAQIVGAIVLTIVGIMFHFLNEMPFKIPIRQRIDLLWQEIDWMFPRSEEPPRHGLIYFLFGIPFGLFILGVEMTGNYTVVQWAFWGTEISGVITAYVFLIVLKPLARKVWTSVILVILGFALIQVYKFLCPTVTISPVHATFAGAFSGEDGVSEVANFRIQNKIDDDVYGIVFKLRVEATSTKERFQVAAPESRPNDIAIQICTDIKNRPVFQGIITRLPPRDSLEVTLTHVNAVAEAIAPSPSLPPTIEVPNHEREIIVDAKISSFNYAEDQLRRPGLQLTKFHNDETLKCTGMVIGAASIGNMPAVAKRIANVSLEFMGPVQNPVAGPVVELWCVNDSDFPANDEHCLSTMVFVKLVDGEVTREDQEKAFVKFERNLQLNPPKLGPKTLEPHNHSRGAITSKDVGPVPKQLVDDLTHGKATFLFPGIIMWSDDMGAHRKEFCRWIVPPANPNHARLGDLYQRTCYGHNRLLY